MNRIINSYLILFLIHSNISEQSLQCGDWSVYKDEKCFKILESVELQKIEDAINTCHQNEGSSLVTIHSQGEQEFLFNLLANIHKQSNNVWIGAHINDMVFKWSDNTTVNYTNWANDNPRNTSGYDCVLMSLTDPYNGKWLNEPCSQKNLIVCQKAQNWLFSYLQQTVIELRKSLDETKIELKSNKDELQSTKSELQKTKSYLENEIQNSMPSGTIAYFANTTVPIGWLIANGQSVSRTTYANLFATISTRFGSGDGSTTFTLPDLRGEFIRGWSEGRDVDKDRDFGSFQWGSSIPLAGYVNNQGYYAIGTAWQDRWNFAGNTFDAGFHTQVPLGDIRNGLKLPDASDRLQNQVSWIAAPNNGNITNWNVMCGTRPRNIALLACIKY